MKLDVAKYIRDHNLTSCKATAFDTLEINMYDDEANWDRIIGIWYNGDYKEFRIGGINNQNFREDIEKVIKGFIKVTFRK